MPRPLWLDPLWEGAVIPLGANVVLTNIGSAYDGTTNSRGLGKAKIDFANVKSLEFSVDVNKVGTGTQSWQLWNVTDGVEVMVLDDAGAAGEKTLSGTITTGIPSGVKVIRVRAKSTVAADDPVYHCAYLYLT